MEWKAVSDPSEGRGSRLQALKDADFRTRLLANPTKVYGEELRRALPGKEIPEGVEVKIAQEAENVFYVILPCIPPAMHLSDDALHRVARHEQTHRNPCWGLGDPPEEAAAPVEWQSSGDTA